MRTDRKPAEQYHTVQTAGEKYRFLFFLTGLLMTAAVVCMLTDSVRTQAASSPKAPVYKYYTTIQIQKGDTLSQIALDHMTEECGSLDEYLEEICEINHISRDSIHSGRYLTIPYYSSEYRE